MTIPQENGITVKQAWFAGGKTGALVREECSKSSPKIKELPKGSLLTVEEEGSTDDGTVRLRISAPVAGWLSKKLANSRDVSDAPDPLSFGLRVATPATGAPPSTKPIGGRALPAWPARTAVTRAHLVQLASAPDGVGDIYGQRMPRTMADVRKFGAAWLTRCFHAAGTLPKDNAVIKILSAQELQAHKGADCAGGAGRKMFLEVAYAVPDLGRLHTSLFVKLPWEPDFHMRGELSLGLGDGDGLEIATYVYLEHLLPCHVPKFYFGDIQRSTTNYVLVTERVPFAARGTQIQTLPAGAVHPACGKYEDFRLEQPADYYLALMRCMGRIAAWDKVGRYEAHMEIFDQMRMGNRVKAGAGDGWKQGVRITRIRAEATKRSLAAIIDGGIAFATQLAPFLCEPEVLDPVFLARFKEELLEALVFNPYFGKYAANDDRFVGLTHTNLQLDNAYFWRGEGGQLDCGLLDWYMCSRTAYAQVWLGCLSGAEGSVLAKHDLDIFTAFTEEHEKFGGPKIDPEDLRERFTLFFPSYIIGNFSKIESHILSETPIAGWADLKSKDDVFDGPWNARCFSIMIANGLSYWYHKGANHPGAVIKKWAATHGIAVVDE